MRVFLCKFLVVSVLLEGIDLQNHMIQEVEGRGKKKGFLTFLKPALDVQKAADNPAVGTARSG